jgi:DNA-binding response OmpR family regulator
LRKPLRLHDEDGVRNLARTTLENGEFEIFEGRGGGVVIELFREHKPGSVLLDVGPEHVLETSRDIRRPHLRTVPFVALTSRGTSRCARHNKG